MVKEAARKCCLCGHYGHNSRTCNGGKSFKLFGVNIENSRKVSMSMENMQSVVDVHVDAWSPSDGKRDKAVRKGRKGIAWTEKEHIDFLAGLNMLGKGGLVRRDGEEGSEKVFSLRALWTQFENLQWWEEFQAFGVNIENSGKGSMSMENMQEMVKEEARKCSHCGHYGHNSRTCNGGKSFKLFGVNIENSRKGSMSRENMQSVVDVHVEAGSPFDGKRDKAVRKGRKGIAWTEKEHNDFLAGLNMLGKGDWKGISSQSQVEHLTQNQLTRTRLSSKLDPHNHHNEEISSSQESDLWSY
ncbi:hypothetical protein LWI29_030643 [Acer saccharum]|uniref:Uncharacterized protein n=1 Tax=Acer saccharum TaxID=4024 RepID=A0AA39T1M8_ACESA|nr:hypothetical protein LWI29_030643 [Acer saccharum]